VKAGGSLSVQSEVRDAMLKCREGGDGQPTNNILYSCCESAFAFPKLETARIAVKVINHLRDEVMKVFAVQH
jgi:hypothetical protein